VEEAGSDEDAFDEFARELEPRLWRALVPLAGPAAATDAAAEALLYAWRHWSRVRSLDNPGGYLYRVARRAAIATDRGRVPSELPPAPSADLPDVEPGLVPALHALTEMQRTVVWLVDGCGWSLAATARLLDLSVSTVRNHQSRGLKRLRAALKVNTDA
jgi:RNA polymerase sigma-70 factor (ECF subfamily)